MADREDVDLELADLLRALATELQRADGDGVRFDRATVELDVAVEADGDGGATFRVAKVQGGTKRGRTTRLTVTVLAAGAEAAPAEGPSEADSRRSAADLERASSGPDAGAPRAQPAEARAPGLVDLLADALQNVVESASRPSGRSWPGPRDDEQRGPGPSR